MGQKKFATIPLNIVITTSKRIKSLSLVIPSVFNTRKSLENGLDINYCILSSDSDSEEYNLTCESLIKKNSKTVDYFLKQKVIILLIGITLN